MGNKFFKSLAFILVLCVAFTMVSCGQNHQPVEENTASQDFETSIDNTKTDNTQKESEQESQESKEPLVIKAVTQAKPDWGGTENNKLLEYIEKEANVKFIWEIPPTTSYYERLNIIMASGDLPDLVFSDPNEHFWNWVDSGLVLPLDDYLDNTPNIHKVVNEAIFNVAKSVNDGKIYAIPRPEPISLQGVYWRKDWLDKLGLNVPETLDEFVAAWRAISDSDFDGNGKKDTYGFSMLPGLNVRGSLFPALGVHGSNKTGGDWLLDDNGKVTYLYLLPNFLEGIHFLADLYKERIIDKEYILNKSESDIEQKFNQGLVGSYFFGSTLSAWTRVKQKTEEVFPGAEVVFTKAPKGPKGQGSFMNPSNIWSMWFITKSAKEPERIIEFLDLMHTDEWWIIQSTGVEGIHYESYDRENEVVVRTDAQAEQWNKDYNPRTWFCRHAADVGFYLKSVTYKKEEFREAYNYNNQTEYYYPTISEGYYPQALYELDEDMPDWRNDIEEVLNKIILGEGNDEEFLDLMDRVRKSGLDDAINEMQEYYDKKNR